MRHQGRIIDWNDERGFGFIAPSDGTDPVFFHITQFTQRSRRPVGDEVVTYILATDERGRPQAHAVSFVREKARSTALPAVMIAAGFLVVVLALAADGSLPPIAPAVYLLVSPIAFLTYAWDKSQAGANGWRVRESKLLFLSLIGGWPGALVARHFFRHKTRKQSFIAGFWGTVLVNCGVLICLLFPDVQRALVEMFGNSQR